MTILDTFYILIKSNAKEASKDVSDLDKQIAELASKGNKRTENETKQLNELRKLRNATLQDLKDVNKATDATSLSLLELGIGALSAAAAFSAFQSLKQNVSQAIDYNAELSRQHILTGESAKDIASLDAAFANSTGKKGEFLGWFSQYSTYLQSIGQDTKNVIPSLKSFADELKALPEDQARIRFQQLSKATGLPADFFIQLRQGGAALDELQGKMADQNSITEKGTEDANAFAKAWHNVGTAIGGAYNRFSNRFTEYFAYVGNVLAPLFSGHPGEAFDRWRNPPVRGASNKDSDSTTPPPSGGIYLDGPAPDDQQFLDNQGVKDTLKRATGAGGPRSDNNDESEKRKALDLMASAQKQIRAADSSPINTVPIGSGGSTTTNSRSLTIGSLVVQTQASSPDGIAQAVNDTLNQHYRATIGNSDDSVAR